MDENSDAPLQTITINGEEIALDEAQALIDKGRMTTDYESKYNTTLDKVWPEYGKVTQENKSLREQAAEAERLKAELAEFRSKQEKGNETPQDEAEAIEALKKLKVLRQDDLEQAGYIKKDDLETYLSERESKKSAIDQVLQKADKLETEIDGSDGRPKFNKRAVMAYASTYGFNSLEEAYEDMHQDTLKNWKEEQVKRETKPGLKTLKSGGVKTPSEPKVNRDNFKKQLNEALWGSEE